jgi:hypothetical protein
MEINEGKIDRIIRIIAGIILLAVAVFFFLENNLLFAVIPLIIGLILVVTGFTGYCLIYKILNINTVGKSAS